MVAITAHCWACSIAYTSVPVVGPDFRVRVEDRGRPVEGLRLKITLSQAVTDKNGIASFRGVAPGPYLVSADLDVGVAGVPLNVKLDGPADVVLAMKWPNIAPVVVRSLKGMIRGPDYLPGLSTWLLSVA